MGFAYVGSGTIQSIGGGWFKVTVTTAAGLVTAGNNIRPQIYMGGSSSASGDSVLVWRSQLESGSEATRYTPTTTTAVAETDYSYEQSTGLITLTRALASDASWMTFGTVVTTPTSSNTIYQASAASTV